MNSRPTIHHNNTTSNPQSHIKDQTIYLKLRDTWAFCKWVALISSGMRIITGFFLLYHTVPDTHKVPLDANIRIALHANARVRIASQHIRGNASICAHSHRMRKNERICTHSHCMRGALGIARRGETTHSGVDVNNTHQSMINPLNNVLTKEPWSL